MLLQYAERLPIGLKEIIETVPASTVAAFYRRWYRPENMAVVVAGDFDPAAVEERLKAALATCHWPSDTPTVPVPKCVQKNAMQLSCYRATVHGRRAKCLVLLCSHCEATEPEACR